MRALFRSLERLHALPAWSLRLWVLASYLFAYGGFGALFLAQPVPAQASPLARAWAKLDAKGGMACGAKKGLICACDSHGKGSACCCRGHAVQGLAWNAAPCGSQPAASLPAFGPHFQAPFPAKAALFQEQASAHASAAPIFQALLLWEAPEGIPRR